MYDDIILFINLVTSGGFNKTAKKLTLQRSKVSRRIKILEENLGGSLIKRNTKKLELTDLGLKTYNLFKDNCTQSQQLIEQLIAEQSELRGTLRIMLPPILAHKIITTSLSEFCNKHPNLQIQLFYLLNTLPQDANFFDLAVSTFIPKQQNLKIRRLYSSPLILCAAPKYLEQHGTPQTIPELNTHKFMPHLINEIPQKLLYLKDNHGNSHTLELNNYQVAYDNMISLIAFAKEGFGICAAPYFIIADALREGSLVQVLPTTHGDDFSFYLVRPEQSCAAKEEAFISFLEKFFLDLKQT